MVTPKSKEKFVGFVDILGFSQQVEWREHDDELSINDLLKAAEALGSDKDKRDIEIDGPTLCPDAKKIQKNLDFQITKVSDCVVVSAELSPAGALAVVFHCWKAVLRLMIEGFMCRGHIRRGNIYHDGSRFIGTAFQDAYKAEGNVSAFRTDDKESGTPYVELDASITDYVLGCNDECVIEQFKDLTIEDDGTYVLFPFGQFVRMSQPNSETTLHKLRRDINLIKNQIQAVIDTVENNVNPSNAKAWRKGQHYINALRRERERAENQYKMFERLQTPFPS
ncbi:hypothetical protein [Salinisphaera sp. T31B1]|uniref:hypothetical protein n=1 Tax=Salinisphaera sp. T31B1 TaxID=727963 RepID=UPI00334145A5